MEQWPEGMKQECQAGSECGQCPLLVEHMVPALAEGHELQSGVAAAQTGFGSTVFPGFQGVGGVWSSGIDGAKPGLL